MKFINILNQLGFEKVPHEKITMYVGVFSSGGMDKVLYDYNAGLLTVRLSTSLMNDNGDFNPFVSISTLDDGAWQAFCPHNMTLEESNRIVEEIRNNWEWKTKLPTEYELNEYLMKFGLMGEYTG